MTTQTTTWPEDVIARYLTVAGSSLGRDDIAVDITATTTPGEPYVHTYGNGHKGSPKERINLTLLAQCQGCRDHDISEHDGLVATVMNRVLESPYGSSARKWAQTHAERCRAIPAPHA